MIFWVGGEQSNRTKHWMGWSGLFVTAWHHEHNCRHSCQHVHANSDFCTSNLNETSYASYDFDEWVASLRKKWLIKCWWLRNEKNEYIMHGGTCRRWLGSINDACMLLLKGTSRMVRGGGGAVWGGIVVVEWRLEDILRQICGLSEFEWFSDLPQTKMNSVAADRTPVSSHTWIFENCLCAFQSNNI